MPQLPPAVDHTGIFLCIFPQPPRIILFFISSFTISRHNPLYKHCPSSRTPITIATHALRPGSSCCRCSAHHPPPLSPNISSAHPLACSRHAILAPMSRLPHTCPCACRTYANAAPYLHPPCLSAAPSCLLPPHHTCPNVALAPYLPLRPPHIPTASKTKAGRISLPNAKPAPHLLSPQPQQPQLSFFYSPVRKTTILACKTKAGRISLPNAKPAPHLLSPQPQQPQLSFFIRLSARQQYLPVKRRRLSASYDTSPVTGSTFSSAASSSPISSNVRCPASALILRSISSANAWLSRNTCLAFSRPCPSFSPL